MKEGYNVIIKNNSLFISNEFWGDMKIYKVNTDRPYIRKLGDFFYFSEEDTKEIKKYLKFLK